MKRFRLALLASVSAIALVVSVPLSASAEPPRRLPEEPLKQNHTLKHEKQCGKANGRLAWRGSKGAQCHLMDNGDVVALHKGRKFDRSRYTAGTPVENQLQYIADYWYTTGPSDKFGYIPNFNCANFISQTLLARGWKMNGAWYYKNGKYSPSWTSSKRLGDYIKSQGGTKLTYNKKNLKRVKLGDVIQFDWENNGLPNHNGVVTKIVTKKDGEIKLFVAGNADPYQYRSVNHQMKVVHPGASAWIWSLPDEPKG